MAFNVAGFRPEEDKPQHRGFETNLAGRMTGSKSGDVDLREFSGPRHNQSSTSSCFPAGTPILMSDYTERPIEEVGIGNKVFTHNGRIGTVTHCFKRAHEEKLYTINVLGYAYPITMTAEHPVFVAKNVSKRRRYFEAGEPEWVEAKDIEPNDYVLLPGNPSGGEERGYDRVRVADFVSEEVLEFGGKARIAGARNSHVIKADIVIDPVMARLLGLFLAEGSYRKMNGMPGGLAFTFARDEVEYHDFVVEAMRVCLDAKADIVNTESRPSVTDVQCNNTTVARFFYALCGEGALKKRVPQVVLAAGRSVRMALLRGWLEGDGTKKKKVHIYEYDEKKPNCAMCTGVTSSKQMHRDLMRLSLLCGLKPSALKRTQASHQNAPGRTLVFYSHDIVAIFPEEAERVKQAEITFSEKHRRHREHPWGFLCRVSSVKVTQPEEPVDVYNLEVACENTYIAGGIAVHNCVANATVKALEIKRIQKLGLASHVDLSRMAVYYLARELMSPSEVTKDAGTYVSHAFDVLRRFGTCKETDWPFDKKKLFTAPTWSAMRSAYVHKITAFYKIRSVGQDRVDAVIACLRAGNPVVYGTKVGSNWQSYKKGHVLGLPGEELGGHATCLVGFVNGKFVGENSWGVGWGDDGFYLMDPAVIASGKSHDFWIPQAGWEELK